MISSDIIRGYNDIMILSLLCEEDSYGYSLSKKIKERTNEVYVIKETTMYSAFNRLLNLGLIESYTGEKTEGRKRTYYKITTKGIKYYTDKCIEWEETKDVVSKFIKEVK